MTQTDLDHLRWIYNRLENVYEINPQVDYMLKFKAIIDSISTDESTTIVIHEGINNTHVEVIDGIIHVRKVPGLSICSKHQEYDENCNLCNTKLKVDE